MQITLPSLDVLTQVDFDQHIQCQPLTGFLDHGDLQLANDLTPRPVGAEKVFGADGVFRAGEIISETTEDVAIGLSLEFNQTGPKADIPALCSGPLNDDWFKNGLG